MKSESNNEELLENQPLELWRGWKFHFGKKIQRVTNPPDSKTKRKVSFNRGDIREGKFLWLVKLL